MPDATVRPPTTYAMDRALLLYSSGLLVIPIGLAVFAWMLAVLLGWWGPPPVVSGVAVAAAVVTLLALLVRLRRPKTLVELTAEGYRLHVAGGVGVKAANWRQVEKVGTIADRKGDPMLVWLLDDGSRSWLPGKLIGARFADLERDVHDRLNAAYGYRRLGDS
ncbi:MAG: hypothetical protein ACRDO2_03070 [Nocardioidaceae bacterium]